MKNYSSLFLFATSLAASCNSNVNSEKIQPNVILILTDDQGWGDFGFNGNDIVRTPVLDSLSRESAHFTDFHVSPLSASTRAGLLTGRDHLRTGSMGVTRSSENMDTREQTIAEIMKQNNYATGCFGKWHNGAHYPQDPNGQGFDEFVGFCAGHLTNYFNSRLQHNQEFLNADGYITDVLTNCAIEFIDENIESNKPFFCYLPYNAPHAPYQAPDEFYNNYTSIIKSKKDLVPAAIYAMCECVDYNIGKLLEHIKQKGVDENTLVVFMSDNGPKGVRYNGDLRGLKSSVYEGGFKVPCLFYWKGKINAVKLPQAASYVDIMPTILDICDIESTPIDGREISGVSLKEIINQKQDKLNDRYLFTHRSHSDEVLNPHDGVVYNSTYKLITFANGEKELYNRIKDPSEKHNIINEEPLLAAKLDSVYSSWFADVYKENTRSISRTAHIGILDDIIELPAHEALMSGRTRYFTNDHGWAGDWLVDISPKDTIYWDVIVDTAADYEITLQYSSISEKQQSVILASNNSREEMVFLKQYKPIEIESLDRAQRGIAYERVWGTQMIGKLHLAKGDNKINLLFSGNKKIKEGSLHIKGIEVKKVNNI